jgi:hypothetical protein
MALKWEDKQNGVDEILAEDINLIANAVVDLQEDFENLVTPDIDLSNYYTKPEIDQKIGNIETALDNIIAIQNELIGGEGV